jgi:hypothetical protein
MTGSLPGRVEVAPDVVFRPVSGEAVILDLTSQCYFSLDETGTRMWQLLADSGDPSQVVEQLLTEYAVERAVLERDLAELVGELLAAGLLRAAG